ncbi:MAG: FAD-dependent oxidoreductase [Candidatus Pacebacteria bacterium]|nr:FAD-dependent oxidoreductase [Candidatus Paceibacterota bacterium]
MSDTLNKIPKSKSGYTWRIVCSEIEAPGVKSLYLEADAERPSFIAGQYLTVRLANVNPIEGRAYSISSAPHEALVRITIKQLGSFSSTLSALQPGETIITSAPYGFFYPEPDGTSPLVFIAGGIGITPILNIIKDLTERKDERPLRLFYSNQTEEGIVFRGELEELAAKNPRLSIHYFITREVPTLPNTIPRRMAAVDLDHFVPEAAEAEYFLCGSMDFTKSLWKTLREKGIKQHQIYTEGFY